MRRAALVLICIGFAGCGSQGKTTVEERVVEVQEPAPATVEQAPAAVEQAPAPVEPAPLPEETVPVEPDPVEPEPAPVRRPRNQTYKAPETAPGVDGMTR